MEFTERKEAEGRNQRQRETLRRSERERRVRVDSRDSEHEDVFVLPQSVSVFSIEDV